MTDKDDILIQQFMSEHAPIVEDRGFSRRVMRHLPRRSSQRNLWWTVFCIVVGVLVVMATNSVTRFIHIAEGFWGDVIGAASPGGSIGLSAIVITLVVMVAAVVMVTDTPAVYRHR